MPIDPTRILSIIGELKQISPEALKAAISAATIAASVKISLVRLLSVVSAGGFVGGGSCWPRRPAHANPLTVGTRSFPPVLSLQLRR